MKSFIFFTVLTCSFVIAEKTVTPATADSTWKKEAIGNFNFSNAWHKNWAAGGDNAVSWELKFNGKIERDVTKNNWKSTGKLGFGQAKQGEGDFRKSLDEIFLETIWSYKFTKLVKPYVAASLQSQFYRGYKYDDTTSTLVSNFWDPGYLTQSAGVGLQPRENLSTRLGFSVKETFSSEHGYADDLATAKSEKFKVEPGLESITEYSVKLNQVLKYQTKLGAFVNFKGVDEIDGKWENLFIVQFSKYINVNLGIDMLYDVDMSRNEQIKENLSIGINYTFL